LCHEPQKQRRGPAAICVSPRRSPLVSANLNLGGPRATIRCGREPLVYEAPRHGVIRALRWSAKTRGLRIQGRKARTTCPGSTSILPQWRRSVVRRADHWHRPQKTTPPARSWPRLTGATDNHGVTFSDILRTGGRHDVACLSRAGILDRLRIGSVRPQAQRDLPRRRIRPKTACQIQMTIRPFPTRFQNCCDMFLFMAAT